MAELSNPERLQPSLLDRLTDEEPRKNKESRERRAMTLRQLRDAVLRDVRWLVNTTNFEAVAEEKDVSLEDLPEVANSVLNYGVPDITGRTSSGLDTRGIERAMQEAIQRFEPRLIAETVRVKVIRDEAQMSHNAVGMVIEGMLWALPVPIQLYLRTDFDMEAGSVNVSELSSPI